MSLKNKNGIYTLKFVKEGQKVKVVLWKREGVYGELDKGHGFIVVDDQALLDAEKKGIVKSYRTIDKHKNKLILTDINGYTNRFNTAMNRKPYNITFISYDKYSNTEGAYVITDNNGIDSLFIHLYNSYTFLNNGKGKKFTKGRHNAKNNILIVKNRQHLLKGLEDNAKKYNIFNLLSQTNIQIIKQLQAQNEIKDVDIPLGRLVKAVKQTDPSILLTDKEVHHYDAQWDNREKSIGLLTQQEHDALGGDRHRIDVHITTIDELIAFMDWIDSDEYKNLWK